MDLTATINCGIGDNIVVKMVLDEIRSRYTGFRISHNQQVLNHFRKNDAVYNNFLMQLGDTLFNDPPFRFVKEQFREVSMSDLIRKYSIKIRRPRLDHLLCKGEPLQDIGEYFIITTKIREIKRKEFLPQSHKLWRTLRTLSERYKIVIMGERLVERSLEYSGNANIYGIYDHIVCNIPEDKIIDLTVPALGIVPPNFQKVQQDCLIMKNAKFNITLGIGGNLWMAAAVGNVIGYRTDGDGTTDLIASPEFTSLFLTKDWNNFISKLESYR